MIDCTTKLVPLQVFRTRMVGGGTSYDVYAPTSEKSYRPIACSCYATVIHRDGGKYYELSDFFRDPVIDALPALTDRRWRAFKALDKAAARLAFWVACKVFPELRALSKLPTLWAPWTLPSATETIAIRVRRDRDECPAVSPNLVDDPALRDVLAAPEGGAA